jgi:hypothetical protein
LRKTYGILRQITNMKVRKHYDWGIQKSHFGELLDLYFRITVKTGSMTGLVTVLQFELIACSLTVND